MIQGKTIIKGLVWVLVLLALGACVPKSRVIPRPVEPQIPQVPIPPRIPPSVSPEVVFNNAEKAYKKGDYPQAEALYAHYFSQNQQGLNADEALYRIGQINVHLNNLIKARNVFQYLIDNHPNSPHIMAGRRALLEVLIKLQLYPEALTQSRQLLAITNDPAQLFQIYMYRGRIYMTLSEPTKALTAFASAYDLGGAEEQARAMERLKGAIHQLSNSQIQLMLGQVTHPLLRGHLLYRLGTNHVQAENLEAATRILTEFITQHPQHPLTPEAGQLLSVLRQSGDAAQPIIGCLLPLSGPYGAFGRKALDGIVLAAYQYNQDHPQKPIELKIEDSKGDEQVSRAAIEAFAQEGVAAVLGPMVAAAPAARAAQQNQIPIITFTQKDGIPEIGDYVFRNFMTYRIQAQALAAYFIQVLGMQRFAILHPQEDYGLDFRNLFWDEVVKQGGRVVGVEGYDPKATDFAEVLKKLTGLYLPIPKDVKETLLREQEQRQISERIKLALNPQHSDPQTPQKDDKPELTTDEERPEEPVELEPIVDFDVLFIPDSPKKVGLIAPQLAFHDVLGVQLAGTNLLHSPVYLDMAKDYIQGSVLTSGFFVESASIPVKRFVRAYQQVYGSDPGYIQAVAYDSAQMLLSVVQQNYLGYRSAIQSDLLADSGGQGVCGQLDFDSRGEIQTFPRLLRIGRKGFSEIDLDWSWGVQTTPESLTTSTQTPSFSATDPSPASTPPETRQLFTNDP